MMGDVAEMFIGGLVCNGCGELIDGEFPGYPRLCDACEEED